MKVNKKNFLVALPFFVISLLLIFYLSTQAITKRQEVRKKASELTSTILFSDDFENSTLSDNWQVRGLTSNFEIDSSKSFSGDKSLKIHNNGETADSAGGGLQAIIYNFPSVPSTGVIQVAFYDYGDNRSAGVTFSISNPAINKHLIFQINENQETFDYRIQDQHLDSGIPRTEGWHLLEFVVTFYGAYGKIDGHSLSDLGIHFELKEIAHVSLGRGWSKYGDTHFDNFQIKTLFDLPSSQQETLDNWSDKVYEIYKNTNLEGIISEIKNSARSHLNLNTSRARVLAGQAMMHAYYYSRDENSEDLEKAKKYIKAIIETHDKWKQAWLSQITVNQLAFNTWWLWNYLDNETKDKFFNLMIEEADFWNWVFEEAKERPWQKTLPREIRTRDCYNIEVITAASSGSKGDADRYLDDTKAEEITCVAQLLATAYSMLPYHPEAEKWNQTAKCYAFHTLNTGEEKCGITGRTIRDDLKVGNHGFFPNHDYAFAGITGIQQGEFSYLLAGKAVPDEFHHNIENKTNSTYWQVNINACRVNNEAFTTSCDCVEVGKANCQQEENSGWKNKDLKLGLFILPYWAKMNNDRDSEQMFNEMLSYFYYLRKGLINDALPFNTPIDEINHYDGSTGSESFHWWKNIERYGQTSAKFYVLSNFQNPEFRRLYFPQDLSSCQPGQWDPEQCRRCKPNGTWGEECSDFGGLNDADWSESNWCDCCLNKCPGKIECWDSCRVTPTPTFSPTPSPTPTPTTPIRPTLTPIITSTPTPTPTVMPTPTSFCIICPSDKPLKSEGNANCDEQINLSDFNAWLRIYLNLESASEEEKATIDFNCSEENTTHEVNLSDFNAWLRGYQQND